MGCVETLKKNGYSGEITIVTKEYQLPYDKTRLSKEIKNLDYNDLLLRDNQWFEQNGVKIMFGRECIEIDKTVNIFLNKKSREVSLILFSKMAFNWSMMLF